MNEPHLSERQQKWFATAKANLEKATGRSMDAWAEIARGCPETGHKARLAWFKAEHGLLQNSASIVLSHAFASGHGWDEPEKLVEALWATSPMRPAYEALDRIAMELEGAIRTPRKGYTAWARTFQFAAARPVKGGLRLGLAASLETDPRLVAPRNESWSERLKSVLVLTSADEVDASVAALLRRSWETS